MISNAGSKAPIANTNKRSNIEVKFDEKNVQHEFKHAKDFGIEGNWNKENAQLFKNKIIEHVNDPETIMLKSVYHGERTNLFYNPRTNIGVHLRLNNHFWTGWKLSLNQLKFNNLL